VRSLAPAIGMRFPHELVADQAHRESTSGAHEQVRNATARYIRLHEW
jgi:hypothetical protein